MYLKTEGIVLYRRNLGEADRIVTFFTSDFGKISVVAKGVRRPKSKKAGHLEPGNWCKIFVAEGKNMGVLCEIETKRAFGIKEFSFEKANKIYHFLEIVKNITPDNQKNYRLFLLLADFLKKITSGVEDFSLVSSCFKIKALSNLGFFSTVMMKDKKAKAILDIMEGEDYDFVSKKVKLTSRSYLKLLAFLDSMIEELAEQKLKTNRFLNPSV